MRRAAWLGAVLVAAACGKAAVEAPAVQAPAIEAPAATPTGPAPGAPEATPLPAAPRDRVPLVGGCKDRCRDARTAMAGFLAATADADRVPEAVLPFLDATRLAVDGSPLGQRWAQQWRDLKSATRNAEMRDSARALGRWTDGLDAAQVRDVMAAGARPLREWTTEATFEVAVPGRPPWRVTLAPRGVEWLVVEVGSPGGER